MKLGVGSCNWLEVISGGRKTEVGSPSTALGLANHKAEQHVIYNDPTFQTCKYQMGKTPTYNVILSFFPSEDKQYFTFWSDPAFKYT